MEMVIASIIARNSSPDPDDILTAKHMLNRLGLYVPAREVGMTRFADPALFDALKAFQKRAGLPETGEAAAQGRQTLNFHAEHYLEITNLRLPQMERQQRAERDLAAFQRELNAKFAGFNSLPAPAKVALMDMIYNIGGTKFTAAKWPSLFAAVSTRDWEKAAAESHRVDVNARRNSSTVALFKQAAAIARSGGV